MSDAIATPYDAGKILIPRGYFCMVDGGMLAGKSLLAHLLFERWQNVVGSQKKTKCRGQMFTPAVDNRGGVGYVTIHSTAENGTPYMTVPAQVVEYMEEIPAYCDEHPDVGLVVIDEGHMYKGQHAKSIETLNRRGIHVIGTYLNTDFGAMDFPMPNGEETTGSIRATAQKHVELFAFCDMVDDDGEICGAFATYSQRFFQDGRLAPLDSGTIAIGGKQGRDIEHKFCYRPVCEAHYKKPPATMVDL